MGGVSKITYLYGRGLNFVWEGTLGDSSDLSAIAPGTKKSKNAAVAATEVRDKSGRSFRESFDFWSQGRFFLGFW